ncbi:hypothetical protein G3578_09785 [Brevibacillus sp. SYP-B805]|uniref:hypothetical protein n=1 Tax=Brevibacillus sp. SYP-B805 TaxID=1578199 RepID=UPI0013EA750D|nr:hypothetical protein [Brevibacillus sp. SYP-B805]NGQ95443.1 hypothetical protein [Brevibacillus sp. SYP-B805]
MTNENTQYWKRVVAYFDRVEKGEERPTYDELVRRAKRTARHGQAANDRVAELEAENSRLQSEIQTITHVIYSEDAEKERLRAEIYRLHAIIEKGARKGAES